MLLAWAQAGKQGGPGVNGSAGGAGAQHGSVQPGQPAHNVPPQYAGPPQHAGRPGMALSGQPMQKQALPSAGAGRQQGGAPSPGAQRLFPQPGQQHYMPGRGDAVPAGAQPTPAPSRDAGIPVDTIGPRDYANGSNGGAPVRLPFPPTAAPPSAGNAGRPLQRHPSLGPVDYRAGGQAARPSPPLPAQPPPAAPPGRHTQMRPVNYHAPLQSHPGQQYGQ